MFVSLAALSFLTSASSEVTHGGRRLQSNGKSLSRVSKMLSLRGANEITRTLTNTYTTTAPSYYLACGATSYGSSTNPSSCAGNVQEADAEEEHDLRCCADSNPGGWNQYTSSNMEVCENVWAKSNIPNCYFSVTFEEGRSLCESLGARLCTMEELQADCTARSGCDMDDEMVWSADKVPPVPTVAPTNAPSKAPITVAPVTNAPSKDPTNAPSKVPTTVAPTTNAPSANNFRGCWWDATPRALSTRITENGTKFENYSVQECQDQCADAGFAYCALQADAHCFCSDEGDYKKYWGVRDATNFEECNCDCTDGDCTHPNYRLCVWYAPASPSIDLAFEGSE